MLALFLEEIVVTEKRQDQDHNENGEKSSAKKSEPAAMSGHGFTPFSAHRGPLPSLYACLVFLEIVKDLAPPVLVFPVPSHHRTYRSVYGGSQGVTKLSVHVCETEKAPFSPVRETGGLLSFVENELDDSGCAAGRTQKRRNVNRFGAGMPEGHPADGC
ncbi:hypothetical protein JCM14720_22500 [Calditerricola yamamurae]